MATARWGRSGMESVSPVLRWGRSGVDGTAGADPVLRWGRSGVTGVGATTLAPIAPQTVEPETIVSLSAPLSGGGFADSYTWRVVSGIPVSFIGTGGSRTFRSPSVMPPANASIVVGVVGVVGGTSTPEVTVTITVLPQTSWYFKTGTGWVGKRPVVQLGV